MIKIALDFQYPIVANALTLVLENRLGVVPVPVNEAEIVICDSVLKAGQQLEHPARQVVLLLPHPNWLHGSIPTHDRLRMFFIVEEPGQPSTLELLSWLDSLRKPPVA